MQRYEYKVIPAPVRGEKARGVKTTADRFALALTQAMNEQAAQGWEYIRADTLPCEERTGLTGRATTYQNMLTFRRPLSDAEPRQAALPAPAATAPAAAPADAGEAESAPAASVSAAHRTLSLVSALKSRAETLRPVQPLTARPAEGEAPPVPAPTEEGSAPPIGPADRKD